MGGVDPVNQVSLDTLSAIERQLGGASTFNVLGLSDHQVF